MKRKIERYLNSKNKSEYSNLDKIFDLFLHGEIKKALSEYKGDGVYPTLNKSEKNIQLNYSFNNIFVIIDFLMISIALRYILPA